jgi:hypothetical protein
MLGTILPRGEVVAESRPVVSRILAIGAVRKFSELSCLMLRVDKRYVNDKSAAKECGLSICSLIKPSLSPVASS